MLEQDGLDLVETWMALAHGIQFCSAQTRTRLFSSGLTAFSQGFNALWTGSDPDWDEDETKHKVKASGIQYFISRELKKK